MKNSLRQIYAEDDRPWLLGSGSGIPLCHSEHVEESLSFPVPVRLHPLSDGWLVSKSFNNVLKKTASALDALLPSILDKAFKGEL